MSKGRNDSAERMSDLFALIRTRRQSGLLSIERYENGRFEEGEISFQKGQPVDAHVGNRGGQDAISWLLMWRQVYFLFTPDSLASTNIVPPASPQPPVQTTRPLSPLPPERPQSNANIHPLSLAPPTSNAKSAFYNRVPRKLVHEQNIMELPLTRPQRSLYLLIDGHRTVADLIRFTNKDVQEVYHLLTELQSRGLILV